MTKKELFDAVHTLNEAYGIEIEVGQQEYPPSTFAIYIKDRSSFVGGLKKNEAHFYLLGIEAGILVERKRKADEKIHPPSDENPLLVGLTRAQVVRLIALLELGPDLPTQPIDHSFHRKLVFVNKDFNESSALIEPKDLWSASGEIREYIQKSMTQL